MLQCSCTLLIRFPASIHFHIRTRLHTATCQVMMFSYSCLYFVTSVFMYIVYTTHDLFIYMVIFIPLLVKSKHITYTIANNSQLRISIKYCMLYLSSMHMYVIFISYAYLSIFHTNLYVNLFNLISFSTFINRVLQPECIILKFNSCLLSKISSRSP